MCTCFEQCRQNNQLLLPTNEFWSKVMFYIYLSFCLLGITGRRGGMMLWTTITPARPGQYPPTAKDSMTYEGQYPC